MNWIKAEWQQMYIGKKVTVTGETLGDVFGLSKSGTYHQLNHIIMGSSLGRFKKNKQAKAFVRDVLLVEKPLEWWADLVDEQHLRNPDTVTEIVELFGRIRTKRTPYTF